MSKRPLKYDDVNHPGNRVSSALVDFKYFSEEEKQVRFTPGQ